MFQRYAWQDHGTPLPPLKREVAKIPRIFAGGILLQWKLIPCSESTRPQAAAAVVQPIPQTHRILKCTSQQIMDTKAKIIKHKKIDHRAPVVGA